ncbi:MAG TPA: diadenylate cyclase [Mariprofundaceae bacterium]|nr:diadenylate cyclase [Mariprofundaceae bacterium]
MGNWQFDVRDVVDIALVAVVVYYVLRLVRGTRAVQMLIGLAMVALVYELARFFGLLTVEWIFGHFFSVSIVVLVVLFQHEIRRGLMRMGVNPLTASSGPNKELIEALVESTFALKHRGWGGLIVIERETGLKHLFESGVEFSAPVRSDVIQAIFCPQAPMHDGALIVHHGGEYGGHIAAARVLLPLARAGSLSSHFGTRHRAALGLSEESDALIIVVSEESGNVRLAEDGELSENLDHTELRARLTEKLMVHHQHLSKSNEVAP